MSVDSFILGVVFYVYLSALICEHWTVTEEINCQFRLQYTATGPIQSNQLRPLKISTSSSSPLWAGAFDELRKCSASNSLVFAIINVLQMKKIPAQD